MAYVYLIKSGNNYKIGYTSNLGFRFAQYITCNPNAQMVQYVRVQKKTKHQLETIIHNEIEININKTIFLISNLQNLFHSIKF